MTDVEIIEKLFNGTGLTPCWKRLLTNEILKYIETRYKDSSGIRETLYRIYHNLEVRPTCQYCGAPVEFKTFHFSKFCSKSCAAKACQEKREQTMLEHYGTRSQFGRKEVREKIAQTNIELYGVENVFAYKEFRDKAKETKLKRYGDENYNNTAKFNETCLRKFGCTAPAQNAEIREKQRQTSFERYGGWWNKEKVSETMKDLYGVEWFTQHEDCISASHTDSAKQKQYDTKREHGTFNTSIPENETYELLDAKFKNVIREYKCDRYPYNCDFYLPKYDIFIECQFSWVHGGHAYDESNKADVNKAAEWKTSESAYYNNAFNIWTNTDVIKRMTAKSNCLHYVEFWNLKEAQDWINSFELS